MKIIDLHQYTNYVGFRYNINKMLRCEAFQMKLNYEAVIAKQRLDLIDKMIARYTVTRDGEHAYTETVEEHRDVLLHAELSVPSLETVYKCIAERTIVDHPVEMDASALLLVAGIMNWFDRDTNIVDKTKLCIPTFTLPLLRKTDNGETKRVYDINIATAHSFVANGMVAHNCIEPFTSNLYLRRTLAGEFTCINKYLIQDLQQLNLWTKDLMEKLIYYKGSVQYIKEIPQHIKDIYKTVWEIKQRSLIEMAADRGAYICQSQSLNLFFDKPNYSKLTSAHFLGWKLGLKTGSYYIRSQSAIDAQNFTIDPEKEQELEREKNTVEVCPMRPKGAADYESCEACSG
jgi:hypothetical protein